MHNDQQSATRASGLGPASDAEQLLNFAEAGPYGSIFWPHSTTQTWGPFRYRYYPRIGAYLGVAVSSDPNYRIGGVYLMGGRFGDQPAYMGQLAEFITPDNDLPSVGGAISLSPGVLSANFNEGSGPLLRVIGTSSVQLGPMVYVVIEDPARVLEPRPPVLQFLTSDSVAAEIYVRSDLPRGAHRGALVVHVCKTQDCSSEYSSSPISLPYRFGVVRRDPECRYSSLGENPLRAVLKSKGETAKFTIRVDCRYWPRESVYFKAYDPEGRVSVSLANARASQSQSLLELTVVAPAEDGVYRGRLELMGCVEADCREEVIVSRGQINYVITRDTLTDASIGAQPRLSALQPLPGLETLAPEQVSAPHVRYVPGEFDVSKFSLRWEWNVPREGRDYAASWLRQPSLTDGGLALVVVNISDSRLLVLDESDGTERWPRDASGKKVGPNIGNPFASSGLIIASAGDDSRPVTRAFDSRTGALVWQIEPGFQPRMQSADSLFAYPYQNSGLIASFDALTGKLRWKAVPSFATGSPELLAVAGTRIYEYYSGHLQVRDAATGNEVRRGWVPGSVRQPIFGKSISISDNLVILVDGGLVAIDMTDMTVKWQHRDKDYVGGTAVHGNVLIALKKGPIVEARNLVDGRLLWSVEPWFKSPPNPFNEFSLQHFQSPPILTDNLVFVSTSEGVFAISRDIGKVLWFYSKPGRLDVSRNGVLTIADPRLVAGGGGRVTAINLR
ncbi:MAG: PQQ-binding-like beta-propeller repeat protein [Burkholderiales bacterium]|nr:PQQ-binding-like beta-propeller repeat protein [Burkholderiales bacterium]